MYYNLSIIKKKLKGWQNILGHYSTYLVEKLWKKKGLQFRFYNVIFSHIKWQME